MDSSVRGIRQMARGLEADVTLGLGTVPSASITMKVVLTTIDPEWQEIQQQLHDLYVRRATAHIREVYEYDLGREQRAAKADRNMERKSA